MKPSSLELGIWAVNLVINNNSNKDVVPELLLSSLLPSFLKFQEIHQLPNCTRWRIGRWEEEDCLITVRMTSTESRCNPQV